jgi:hypothetical protein
LYKNDVYNIFFKNKEQTDLEAFKRLFLLCKNKKNHAKGEKKAPKSPAEQS